MKKSRKWVKTMITAVVAVGIATFLLFWKYEWMEKPAESVNQKKTVHLKFTYWGSLAEKKEIEHAMRKFSETYPWITVEPIQIPNSDYNTKIMAMSASNEEPDLGYMTPDLGEVYAKQGKFLNIYSLVEKDPSLKKEDFLDYIWYESSPDYAWGISTAAECFGLYYRKDILRQAGGITASFQSGGGMDLG